MYGRAIDAFCVSAPPCGVQQFVASAPAATLGFRFSVSANLFADGITDHATGTETEGAFDIAIVFAPVVGLDAVARLQTVIDTIRNREGIFIQTEREGCSLFEMVTTNDFLWRLASC